MKIIFFNSSIKFLEVTDTLKDDYCAFWYTPGLLTYQAIDSVVNFKDILIEASIEAAFKKDYPRLTEEYTISSFSDKPAEQRQAKTTLFLASNDTIVYSFLNVVNKLSKDAYKLYCKIGENAKNTALKEGIEATETRGFFNKDEFDLLVMGNDWGILEQKVNYDFIAEGKNTTCIQESVIDFNIRDERMLHCSIPIYQGIATLKSIDLKNKICAVIGNPRYEKLQISPLPNDYQVLVNVNFTYNIFEEARQQWVDDIVGSCKEVGINYCISQHPRDRGDLASYNLLKTNAGNVHAALKSSSILVTRFSSLIHESLCLGRPVIYYNPHGEKLFYDFEPDNKCLIYATNKEELLNAINFLSNGISKEEILESIKKYLPRHLGMAVSGEASAYIKTAIEKIKMLPPFKKVSALKRLNLFVRVIKKNLFE